MKNFSRQIKRIINNSSNTSLIHPQSTYSASKEKTNKQIKKVIEIKKGKCDKKLEFSFFEILFGYCIRSQNFIRKRKLYFKSRPSAKNYLEVSFLISKLDDLSKLQFLIFSKEQTALFNFISQNLCSLDDKKMKNNPIKKYTERFNNDFEMASTYLSYKEALSNGVVGKTRIDDRLMILLNEQLNEGKTIIKKEVVDNSLTI